MNVRLVAVISSLLMAGCAGTPITSPLATLAPPAVECLGDLGQATCDKALPVALDAVRPSGWTPTHVWFNSGTLCPAQSVMFQPGTPCPEPTPPGGGKWVGNGEIEFAGTDEHAGMQIASVGDKLQAVLIGYAVPALDWCSGECPTSSTTDGPYRLELVLPHLDWRSTDPISGTAILSETEPGHGSISGSSRLIEFSYAEVGGDRKVQPIWAADCAPHQLEPATPLTQPLGKSGAIENDFSSAFLPGPDVKLPAGVWDITAIAWFNEGPACSHEEHRIEATVRVTVTD